MNDWLALPAARRVQGAVTAPPSKSATNRALVLAALFPEPAEVVRPLDSDDTRALARCLAAMGARIEQKPGRWRIRGPLRGSSAERIVLDAGSSGTAARFLTALAAAIPGRWRIQGSPRLSERPIRELVDALVAAGARIRFAGARPGFLPVEIEGGSVLAGEIPVDASGSGQFLSAILLVGAAIGGGVTARPTGEVASRPYVEATVEALAEFGWEVRRENGGAIAVGSRRTSIREYSIPGDWSSALPILAATGIAGGEVSVRGLRWPSGDADALASKELEGAGIVLERGDEAITAQGERGLLRAVSIRASDFPDAVPTLASVALFADGESRFHGVAHLRAKESDRIASLARLVESAGASAREGEAELAVTGPPSRDDPVKRLSTFDDHRIAIAAALVSLGVPGALVENPRCVAKSYPSFFRDLETILVRG